MSRSARENGGVNRNTSANRKLGIWNCSVQLKRELKLKQELKQKQAQDKETEVGK